MLHNGFARIVGLGPSRPFGEVVEALFNFSGKANGQHSLRQRYTIIAQALIAGMWMGRPCRGFARNSFRIRSPLTVNPMKNSSCPFYEASGYKQNRCLSAVMGIKKQVRLLLGYIDYDLRKHP